MVEKLNNNEKLLKEFEKLYEWLDSQISNKFSSECEACGKCCDFISYDHRLYVTVPEIMYLAMNLGADSLEPMKKGICPFNKEGKCTVYELRFSGCRIFNCKADPDIQSELSESTLRKLKAIHTKYKIPYRYMELSSALNEQVTINNCQ